MGLFGWQHLLYLGIVIPLTIVGIFLVKRYCRSEKSKRIVYWSTAIAILLFITITRVATTFINPLGWRNLVPSSICLISHTVLALAVLFLRNKNHGIFHGIVYIVILGATIVTFAPGALMVGDPNYTGTIFEVRAFFSLLYHSIGLFLAILLIVMGEFKPT